MRGTAKGLAAEDALAALRSERAAPAAAACSREERDKRHTK
jgi:hypothetical protein